MARRTIHIPDELDERVRQFGGLEDSYSSIVADALEVYLDLQSSDEEVSEEVSASE